MRRKTRGSQRRPAPHEHALRPFARVPSAPWLAGGTAPSTGRRTAGAHRAGTGTMRSLEPSQDRRAAARGSRPQQLPVARLQAFVISSEKRESKIDAPCTFGSGET